MGKFRDIWDRSKDGGKQEQRSFVRVALVSTAIFLVFMLIKKDNILRWGDAALTIRKQETVIRSNEKMIRTMEDRIKALRTDRDTLETFARENLHFSENGDDVYLIPEKQQ